MSFYLFLSAGFIAWFPRARPEKAEFGERPCIEVVIYDHRTDSIIRNHYKGVIKAWNAGNHKPLDTYSQYQNIDSK